MSKENLKEYAKIAGSFIIMFLARLIILRHRPKIVAVVGTVGKTTTKDMIAIALSKRFFVKQNIKSYNSKIGLALTIIGTESPQKSGVRGWAYVAWRGLVAFLRRQYPSWLVLEIGIDKPGDMDSFAGWLKPRIAVITAFGEIPAHVENFESVEQLMAEKSKIINYVEKGGAIFLNSDDAQVMKLKSHAKCKTYTYGITAQADINATHAHCVYNEINIHRPVTGINFKMNFEGHSIPFTMPGVLGDGYVYPVMAGVMVGVSLGIPAVESARAIAENYRPAPRRMNIVAGRNNSILIDDTYNASPLSMQSALTALRKVEVRGLKIAVIGDMLEIGRYSHSAHKQLGDLIAGVPVDFLVTVGIRAEITAESAYLAKLHKSKIRCFKSAENAIDEVKKLQKKEKGSIILIKGSHAMNMDKIVDAVSAHEGV